MSTPPSRFLSAAALLGAVVLVQACKRDQPPPQVTTQSGMVVGPENVAVVKTQQISTGPTISGTLNPEEQATVRAEVGGPVLQTYAEQGQQVTKGATLVRIDDYALHEQVTSAQSAVTTGESLLALDQREVQRNQVLLDSGAVAPRDVDVLRNNLATAQAQLANARAQLANAQKQMDKTTVSAPFTGIVSARQVSAGDVVQPGTALYTVVNPATMQLEASVPAGALSAVRLGTPVSFSVNGYPGRTFTGTITRINPLADPSTREVRIMVSIPNETNSLVGGLFADGQVTAGTHGGAIVPADAVDEHGLHPTVMLLKHGHSQATQVALGVRDPSGQSIEITSGVQPGDTVLLGTARGIAPGTAITISAPGELRAPGGQ